MMNNIDICPSKKDIEFLITGALKKLYEEDNHLIVMPDRSGYNGNHHVGERAIVFRLAHYMQNMMNNLAIYSEYKLDCEYNRNIYDVKVLPSFPNGIYPDIIIHKRGTNDCNLLVMEVKTYWNTATDNDRLKIKQLIDPNGEYRYKFGFSLVIEKNYDATQKHFDELKCYKQEERPYSDDIS